MAHLKSSIVVDAATPHVYWLGKQMKNDHAKTCPCASTMSFHYTSVPTNITQYITTARHGRTSVWPDSNYYGTTRTEFRMAGLKPSPVRLDFNHMNYPALIIN